MNDGEQKEEQKDSKKTEPGCLYIITRSFFRVILACVILFFVVIQSELLLEQIRIASEDNLLFLQEANDLESDTDILEYFNNNIRYRYNYAQLQTFGLGYDANGNYVGIDLEKLFLLEGLNPIEFGATSLEDGQQAADLLRGNLYFRISDITQDENQKFALLQSLIVFWDLAPLVGMWLLYVMPAYVLGLPILTVFSLRGAKGMTGMIWWIIMLTLIGALVLTAALDYVALAQLTSDLKISGYDYLADFGAGIFGGLVTGTALAFLTAAFNFFGGSKE